MRQVLLIDDLRSISVPDADVVIARTLRDGLARIGERPWSCVLLDHDLGPGGDVREIVRLLEERGFNGDPLPIERIVIVSKNPVAVEWMTKGLERYYEITVRPGPLEIPSTWV